MDPRLTLAAALVAAAPLPALAQTWPATVVSSAARIAATTRPEALTIQSEVWAHPAQGAPQTQPERLPLARAKTPTVEIQAKPEWSDDQGVRFSFNRVTYKQRF